MALTQEQIRNLETYDPEAVGAPAVEELVVLVDHPSFEQPMKAPYIVVGGTIIVDPDLSREELLTILGVSDILETTDLTDYVAKVTGKSLINDTEITRLSTLRKTVFTIEVPTGDVSERASGATVKPEGWVLAAASNPNDIQITHNLGRKFSSVTVSYIDGTEQVLLMGNLGYTGVSAPSDDVLIIKGLSTKAFPLVIQLIFA